MSTTKDLAWQLREGLNKISLVKEMHDSVRVTTHCMYPSNGLVSVVVRAGVNVASISDEGAAISEAASAGITKFPTDKALSRLVEPQGLIVKKGTVLSPPVPISSAHVAVLLVANGSKQIAEWLYQNANLRVVRDFKAAVTNVLELTFPNRLNHLVRISGARKTHRFANVVTLSEERKLIVDAVTPDISSISTCVIEHLDVRQTENPAIIQRIIYDDEMEWSTENLKMLGMSEVPVLAFSRSPDRLAELRHYDYSPLIATGGNSGPSVQ